MSLLSYFCAIFCDIFVILQQLGPKIVGRFKGAFTHSSFSLGADNISTYRVTFEVLNSLSTC